ncbi:MAG TPA: DUF3388 domain-containing protein [Verrucomicrobiae bacterium]|nr:DUF3388 domain-containing protein [Verrucomicrobiae bacterium]
MVNRPGLMGSVTTLLGMLSINILQVTSVGEKRRGFLIECRDAEKIKTLARCLEQVENIKLTVLREPTLLDHIALKHGKRLQVANTSPPTYCFIREELGLLINFLGDILKEGGDKVIGIRGMPRVGKSEASIAACVYANKKWTLISSTIIRQTMRTQLAEDEGTEESIFLIDAITSTTRGTPAHRELLNRILRGPGIKIVEHPDVLVRDGGYPRELFDLVVELRNFPEQEIKIQEISSNFSAFDMS